LKRGVKPFLGKGANHQSAPSSEVCRVVRFHLPREDNGEPSLVRRGEGQGRGEALGSAALKNPAA
jgi:hypothetical protein